MSKRKLNAKAVKAIRKYVSKHKTIIDVYKILGKQFGCTWQRIREVADQHYGLQVLVKNRKRLAKKVFEDRSHLLTPQQFDVVRLRLYDSMSLQDIAKKIGVNSRERARQILVDSLKKINLRDWRESFCRYKSIF